MAKSGNKKADQEKSGNKKRRGFRHGTLVELEETDKERLEQLVDKYQKLFAGKANKVGVIRQLIRHAAAKLPSVPPLIE